MFACMQGLCLNCCLVSLLFMLAGEVIFCFVLFCFSKDVVIFFTTVTADSNNSSSPDWHQRRVRDKEFGFRKKHGFLVSLRRGAMPRSSPGQALSLHMGRLCWAAGAPPHPLPSEEGMEALPCAAGCTTHMGTRTAPVLNTAVLI